jgi:hypothetical protein
MVEFEREFDRPSLAGIAPFVSEQDFARKETLVEPAASGPVDAAGDALSAVDLSPAEPRTDSASLTVPTPSAAPVDEVVSQGAPERDRRAVVSLVSARQAARGKRGSAARAPRTGRSTAPRASTVDGALAREMSHDEAIKLARGPRQRQVQTTCRRCASSICRRA